jgi:hypothetical protein
MIAGVQQRHMNQLSLFAEEFEGPSWHDFNENTRKDAIRYLAQLIVRAQEGHLAAAAMGRGGQDDE